MHHRLGSFIMRADGPRGGGQRGARPDCARPARAGRKIEGL